MPIRFQCPACNQPIEVDDPWGGKLVACPYCRKTVTAPLESTLSEADLIPTASPLGATLPPGVDVRGAVVAYAPQGNHFAIVSAGLCGFVALLLGLSFAIASAHSLELEELARQLAEAGNDVAAQFDVFQRFMREQQRNGIGWLFTLMTVEIMILAGSLCALVFGILGLSKPARRGLAALTVTASGVLLLLSCIRVF